RNDRILDDKITALRGELNNKLNEINETFRLLDAKSSVNDYLLASAIHMYNIQTLMNQRRQTASMMLLDLVRIWENILLELRSKRLSPNIIPKNDLKEHLRNISTMIPTNMEIAI